MKGVPFKEYMNQQKIMSRKNFLAVFFYGMLSGCMLMFAFMTLGLV